MHIRHLILASLSFFAAGFAFCGSSVSNALEALDSIWPAFTPSPTESLALDRVQATIEASPTPLDRFLAFAKRALLHARYSAGKFNQGEVSFAT